MRFAFTDEQLAMRDAVRDFFEKECPPKVVRDAWTNDTGRSGLWPKLGEIGVLGVLAPEGQGGLGGDFLDLVLLFEETGRAALPEPIVEHAAVAVPALSDANAAAAGDDDRGGSALPLRRVSRQRRRRAARRELRRCGRPSGEPRPTVDGSRRTFDIGRADSRSARCDDAGHARYRRPVARSRAASARHLGRVRKQRQQFGVPIGSFQAIKHKLADVRLALEFARPVVYRAAYSVAHDDPNRPVHVSMAKAYASDAALLAARHALQVHGAIGYSFEHDLHLWMKRVWALAADWGDAGCASRPDPDARSLAGTREEHRA